MPDVPEGYERVERGTARGVALRSCADAVRDALADRTLHAWASERPHRQAFRGRGVSWAVSLGGIDVVVRHSEHGGLLAPLTGDRFLAPTRAPRELSTAVRLQRAGVRTPEVVSWVTYPAAPMLLRRADVATRLVPGGRDLAAVLADPTRERGRDAPWVRATGALLRALAAAGAHHPDLNLKNVLLAPSVDDRGALDAWALDVDVVRFRGAESARRVAVDNLARLERSLAKWRAANANARMLGDDELLGLRVASSGIVAIPDAPSATADAPAGTAR